MALKLPAIDAEPIDLYSYRRYLEAHVDFREPDSLIRSAPMLQRLAANREFLGDWMVNAFVNGGDRFQAGNQYNYQSMVLAVTDEYLIRANFWMPEHKLSTQSDHESRAFGYGIGHNHNFHLLTVGYFGNGYETDLCRLAEPERIYEIGEFAETQPVGRWRLGLGEVMFYEAFADIHVQNAPQDLSVSLNLMTHSTRDAMPQFMFDMRSGRVESLVDSPLDSRIHLLTMARHLLAPQAEAALRHVAETDSSPRLRQLARDALVSGVAQGRYLT